MSSEEFSASSSGEEEEYSDDEFLGAADRAPVVEFEKNVGKSLRNDLRDVATGKSVVRLGEEIFSKKFQLPLGKREKRMKLQAPEEEEADFDMEMEEWLANQSLSEEEEEEDAEESAPAVVLRPATSLVNAKHVRNQRKTEAELIGLRIHLQPLIEMSNKAASEDAPLPLGPLRSLFKSVLQLRKLVCDKGSVKLQDEGEDLFSWDAMKRREDALWEEHVRVIEAAERRMQLTSSGGGAKKTLKVMNRGAIEQTESALARRAEIAQQQQQQQPSFFTEDQAFYSQLLRDFVATRSSALTTTTAMGGKNGAAALGNSDKQKSRRDYHLAKKEEGKMNYSVHDKLVNFIAPITLPAPTIDLDQFVKSLFQ